MNIKQYLYNYCCLSSNNTYNFFNRNQTVGKDNRQNSQFKSDSLSQNCYGKRLQDVLGRPVTKPILDSNNNLIIDVGDLITYEIIKKAKKANLLPKLLKAVYYCKSD